MDLCVDVMSWGWSLLLPGLLCPQQHVNGWLLRVLPTLTWCL